MKRLVGIVCIALFFGLSACQTEEETVKESTTKETAKVQDESSSSADKGNSLNVREQLKNLYDKNNSEEYVTVGFYASEQKEKDYLIAFVKENGQGSAEQIRVVTSKNGKYNLNTEDMDVQLEDKGESEAFTLPDVQSMEEFSVKHTYYYEDVGGEPAERYFYYVHDITEKEPRLTNTNRAPRGYGPGVALKGVQCKNNETEVEKCLSENFQ